MRVSILAPVFMSVCAFISVAQAEPLTGTANAIGGAGLPFAGVIDAPISGDLNIPAGTLRISAPFNPSEIELLGPGSYTRPDRNGGTISVTVGPDQLGAYIVLAFGVDGPSALRHAPMFSVWDVSLYFGGVLYTSTDSDGDGQPGWELTTSTIQGNSFSFDFHVGGPPPDASSRIVVNGIDFEGLESTWECISTGGRNISLTSEVDLIGTAELALPTSFFIDGLFSGVPETGMLDVFLAVGEHSILTQSIFLVTTPSGTTARTRQATHMVTIEDTVAPSVDIVVVDAISGAVVTEAFDGEYNVDLVASDVCDPDPVTSGMAVPVFDFQSGDSISIGPGVVPFPISAINMSATVMDASGNSGSGSIVIRRVE